MDVSQVLEIPSLFSVVVLQLSRRLKHKRLRTLEKKRLANSNRWLLLSGFRSSDDLRMLECVKITLIPLQRPSCGKKNSKLILSKMNLSISWSTTRCNQRKKFRRAQRRVARLRRLMRLMGVITLTQLILTYMTSSWENTSAIWTVNKRLWKKSLRRLVRCLFSQSSV